MTAILHSNDWEDDKQPLIVVSLYTQNTPAMICNTNSLKSKTFTIYNL